jgi:hypothetical protein
MELILKGQEYLLYIIFIMMSVGMIKEFNLFSAVYGYLLKAFKSKRVIVTMMSAFTGILPIPGRVTTSAGLLDTMAPDCKDGKHACESRSKFGIIDYLATHHYYLWSPIEKTIIIPMGALGLTYLALIEMLLPLLVVTLALVLGYIFYYIKEEDIVFKSNQVAPKMSAVTRAVVPFLFAIGTIIYGVNPAWAFGGLTLYYMILTYTWDYKKLLGYVNWNVIITIAIIIGLANYARGYESEIKTYLQGTAFDFNTLWGVVSISAIGFFSSLALGSSSRFVALSVLLASIYGVEYFVWFFAVEFAGYLVSPTHKCAAIGMTYFGTPVKKYASALGLWALLVVTTAGLLTFA